MSHVNNTKKLRRRSLILTIITLLLTMGIMFFFIFFLADDGKKSTETLAINNKDIAETEDLPQKGNSVIRHLHPTYQIDAELDSDQYVIKGTMEVTFDNPKTEEILFYLYEYPDHPIKIKRIYIAGKGIDFVRNGERSISFQNPYRLRERIAVQIEFSSYIPRAGTRYGYKDNVWLLTHWYPMLGVQSTTGEWYMPQRPASFGGDPFYYQHGNYTVHFTAPSSIKWVTTGVQAEQNKIQGNNVTTWEARNVLNFALTGSTKYTIEQLKSGNTTITVAFLNTVYKDKILEMIDQTFTTYTRRFGPLASDHVGVVETGNGTVFAMEYANLAIYSIDMYEQNLIEHWIPHEVAHLWWYNTVSTVEPLFGWIDEGLADAGVAAYLEERYGSIRAQSKWNEYENNWLRLQKSYPDSYLGKGLYDFNNYIEFRRTWYTKSALLFHRLEKNLGRENYEQFLKLLNGRYVSTMVGPEQLDLVIGEVVNGEVYYFRENLYRKNRDGFADPVIYPYLKLIVNGDLLEQDVKSRLINDTPYIPLRLVSEKLGLQVNWDEEKELVVIRREDQTWEIKPSVEVESRSMVPISFFEEEMDLQVIFDEEEKTVIFP